MTVAFADTSYFLALLIPTDIHHVAAQHWAISNWLPLITTDYVVMELGNYLSPMPVRNLFARFWRTLQSNDRIQIIHVSYALMVRGIELFDALLDKARSLTDCVSFVVMKDNAIDAALTADHHFEQAGFTTLLKQS